MAFAATSASAEGIKNKIELEKGLLKLKVRADTLLLPEGDGAYRVSVHFHTEEANDPHPCLLVAMKVDTLNPKAVFPPDPILGIRFGAMKLTDDHELKIKIVQDNAPASQTIVFHLFSTDPLSGKAILLFGTQWQLGKMTALPQPLPGDPIPGPGQCQIP